MKVILHAKRISFRRFIFEGLATGKLGQVVEMERGKWRQEAHIMLVHPSFEEVTIC